MTDAWVTQVTTPLNSTHGSAADESRRVWRAGAAGSVRAVPGVARRPSLEVTVALVVFLVAWAGLAILRDRTAPHYRLSTRAAIAAAQRDAQVSRYLKRFHFTRAESIPLDRTLRRVTFFDGPRVVLDAAVAPDRTVRFRQEHTPGVAESGSTVANSPLMLALLTALFVLSTAVLPLARLRNLDVLVMTSFVGVVLLLNARLVVASVAVATPALAYLFARCAVVGLALSSVPGTSEGSTSLYDHLTRAWPTERRVRLLRLVTGATALAFLMITLTSTGETDVAAASLSGATNLIHGLVPYGHIADGIVHGDTYPLLTYVFYVPGALWMPVIDAFSDLSGALPITAVAALLGAWGLQRIAARLTSSPTAPFRASLAWLSFSPVLLAASGGSNDLVLAALVVWLLTLAGQAGRSSLVLAAACWTKVVPLILVPVWLARLRGRDLKVALVALVGISGALIAWLLALGGADAIREMVDALSFQFQRASFHAPWRPFGLSWLQIILQAALLALLALATLRAWRNRGLRTDLPRLAGLSGALLLGVQLTANYWTWAYLPWAFPCIAAALLIGGDWASGPRSRSVPRAVPRTPRPPGRRHRGARAS